MTTHASGKLERPNSAADRRVNPQQALAAASRVHHVPVIFGDFDSDVPVMVGALAVNKARPPAWGRHDHGDEVLFVLSGHFTMALRDSHGELTRHEAKAGDMLLIPKGSAHMGTLHTETAEVLFLTPRTGTREWSDGQAPPEPALVRDAPLPSQRADRSGDAAPASASDASEPYASLMRYKRWADEQLFAALLGRSNIEAEPQIDFIREIIGHFHVVDRIFQAHLQGVAHAFTGTRLQGASTLMQLKDEVSAVDQWYVDYAQSVASDALVEKLPVRFTDGTEKVLTRAAVLLHISHHGAYHRGNVGVLMRMLGMDLPPDRFFNFIDDEGPHD